MFHIITNKNNSSYFFCIEKTLSCAVYVIGVENAKAFIDQPLNNPETTAEALPGFFGGTGEKGI